MAIFSIECPSLVILQGHFLLKASIICYLKSHIHRIDILVVSLWKTQFPCTLLLSWADTYISENNLLTNENLPSFSSILQSSPLHCSSTAHTGRNFPGRQCWVQVKDLLGFVVYLPLWLSYNVQLAVWTLSMHVFLWLVTMSLYRCPGNYLKTFWHSVLYFWHHLNFINKCNWFQSKTVVRTWKYMQEWSKTVSWILLGVPRERTVELIVSISFPFKK